MPTILHISGPPSSGKSTLANALAAHCGVSAHHHVRFELEGRSQPGLRIAVPPSEELKSLQCTVTSERIFEEVSDVLRDFEDGTERIIVETNADPCFRHAYPYDVKAFVLTPPHRLGDIFRSPSETAGAIDRAMNDTAEFAAAVFGVEKSPNDSSQLPAVDPGERQATDANAQSVEEFLQSDVGAEIASRMRLQPEFHAIIDSDVILLNESAGADPQETQACAREIEALLEPLRRRFERRNWFAVCDPLDANDPMTRRALDQIASLLEDAAVNAR